LQCFPYIVAAALRRSGTSTMGAKHFGARVARLEDPALLTGRGRFVDDIRLVGTLHACFVRSPHAHAKIRSIEASAARAMPGVHAVLTADDLPPRMARAQIPMLVPNPSIATPRTQLALARREVCYVGQTIAVAIAENRYLAEDAAAAVKIDFEVLPAVSDCRDAAMPDAPSVHSDLTTNIAAVVPMSYGDVESAFARAAHVFREEFSLHRGGAMTLEGRAVLASYDAVADMLTVWSATQTPHLCRATLADLFERDLEAIRVIAPHVGGGFGTKAPFYAEEAVIPAAAMKLGRPIAWQEDRREHFLSATQERDQYWKVAIAVDEHGKILGLSGTLLHDTGAFLPWGIIVPYIAATTLRRAGLSLRGNRRAHQPRADDGRARRRPTAGGLRHGAADGSHRARAQARSRRIAPAQHDRAPSDALFRRLGLPRRQAARLCERRLSEKPTARARTRGLRGLSDAPAPSARQRMLPRHRGCKLRGRHRPWAVRGRDRARAPQR